MRTVLAMTIALALGAPAAAATTDSTATALSQMVGAYQQIHAVRVIEKFENGVAATVDVIPPGQYRIASNGGQDPSLVVRVACQPGSPDIAMYNVSSLGTKSIDGAKAQGFKISSPDGSYTESLWVNDHHLPVQAHVDTQGHSIDVLFGDYNASPLIATPQR